MVRHRQGRAAQRQTLWRPIAGLLALTAATSAGLTYLFDPSEGRRRRAIARDRAAASVRRCVRGLARSRRAGGAWLYGYTQKLRHLRRGAGPEPDDVTLTHEVESALFRNHEIPKGRLNVDVADGVVALRGELDRPEQIQQLEATAQRVAGVREVRNLLHLAGTPAPNKAAARYAAGAGDGLDPSG